MRLMSTILCGVAVPLSITDSANAQPVPTHDDVTYATVGGRDLSLDLYLPESQETAPVLIWIHGGGWSGGSNASPAHVPTLNALGIAVASVQYRLTSQADLFGGEPVIWPAQIHDVKAAVRFLKAEAQTYNLDTTRFAAWGTSAGGHLSTVLTMTANDPFLEGTVGDHLGQDSSINVGINYFGPSELMFMQLDITDPPGSTIDHDAFNSPESRLVGWDEPGQGIGDIRAYLGSSQPPYDQLIPLVRSASPAWSIDPGDPPLFIGHGDQDTSVPLNQSQRVADRCAQSGVIHEFMIAQGAGHGFLGGAVDNAAIEFLRTHLNISAELCSADVNNDGALTPTDFTAWVNAFNNDRARCDQNSDGACTPTDFTAWIDNYNDGCD